MFILVVKLWDIKTGSNFPSFLGNCVSQNYRSIPPTLYFVPVAKDLCDICNLKFLFIFLLFRYKTRF